MKTPARATASRVSCVCFRECAHKFPQLPETKIYLLPPVASCFRTPRKRIVPLSITRRCGHMAFNGGGEKGDGCTAENVVCKTLDVDGKEIRPRSSCAKFLLPSTLFHQWKDHT